MDCRCKIHDCTSGVERGNNNLQLIRNLVLGAMNWFFINPLCRFPVHIMIAEKLQHLSEFIP